jgi:hypothetical protein
MGISYPPPYEWPNQGWSGIQDCEAEPPPGEHWLGPSAACFDKYPDGYYRGIAEIHSYKDEPGWPPPIESLYYDNFDFRIDLE